MNYSLIQSKVACYVVTQSDVHAWHWDSPFQLMSLIYAEKFEFENSSIMEEKQCKQMERSALMAKGSDSFLSLDDKSEQRYKVKFNNMQGYDPYQIKKEELLGNISKFPQVQWRSLLKVKEELKVYESFEFYNHFASTWAKEI